MLLKELIPQKGYILNLKSATKKEVIAELVGRLVELKEIKTEDEAKVVKLVLDREKKGSTGLGSGIAIPHCKFDGVEFPVAVFGRSEGSISFDAIDGEGVNIFFLVISPKKDEQLHIEALQHVSKVLQDDRYPKFLREADDDAKIRDLLFDDIY